MATATAGYPSYDGTDDALRRQRRQVTDTYQLGLVNNTWGKTRASRAYDQSRSGLVKQFDRMREGFASPFAGRGLLNSGIYQNKLTQLYGDQNGQLADLKQNYADQLGQLGAEGSQLTSNYDSGLADVNTSMADRQAAIAEQLRRVRSGY